MRQSLHRFDAGITQWVSTTFGQQARPFFEVVTALGNPLPVTLVSIGVVGSGLFTSNHGLTASGAMIPLTIVVGSILKLLFERARPMTEYALNMKLQTFSFPSGHSSGSMIAYGLLALMAFGKLPQPWSIVVGGLLLLVPLAVGMSRVYLGAHFPSDVLAGWALGLAMLIVVIYVIRPFV